MFRIFPVVAVVAKTGQLQFIEPPCRVKIERLYGSEGHAKRRDPMSTQNLDNKSQVMDASNNLAQGNSIVPLNLTAAILEVLPEDLPVPVRISL